VLNIKRILLTFSLFLLFFFIVPLDTQAVRLQVQGPVRTGESLFFTAAGTEITDINDNKRRITIEGWNGSEYQIIRSDSGEFCVTDPQLKAGVGTRWPMRASGSHRITLYDNCSGGVQWDSKTFTVEEEGGLVEDGQCDLNNDRCPDGTKCSEIFGPPAPGETITPLCLRSGDGNGPVELGESCSPNPDSLTTFRCAPPEQCVLDEEGNYTCRAPEYLNPALVDSPCSDDTQERGCASIKTAFGRISTDVGEFVQWVLKFILGIAGGIVTLLIIVSGYRLMTSQGNPEKVQAAREQLTSAIVGLLFIIFSLFILQLITVDILKIPGFTP